jgi:hypothetical protein
VDVREGDRERDLSSERRSEKRGGKGQGKGVGEGGRDRQISRLVINEEQRSDGEGS